MPNHTEHLLCQMCFHITFLRKRVFQKVDWNIFFYQCSLIVLLQIKTGIKTQSNGKRLTLLLKR